MKRLTIFYFVFFNLLNYTQAQELTSIKLNNPDINRGLPVMRALATRASAREWSDQKLSLQDLSDLLWAANGVNRTDEGKRTAPSAMNAQDIGIYVFMKEGIYLYDAFKQILNPILKGDYRSLAGKATDAPVVLVLVSDISRFPFGDDSLKLSWADMDAGIVSQNISVFCAATELKTRPRASFDKEKTKETLKLKDTQYPILNHPVGYSKK